jgi:methylenetetrahydrofolate reductase (NADPH)
MKRPVSEAERSALYDAIHGAFIEIFPAASVEAKLDVLEPDTVVTITCPPTRGIDEIADMAARLRSRGFRIVPHVAARSVRDEAHLRELVARFRAFGIRHLFVVGGDARDSVGPFTNAVELLRPLSELDHGIHKIGIAAHPEGFGGIDESTLFAALREKQPYAHYMVTQICFDPKDLSAWIVRARDAGIALPVRLGIPGVVNRSALVKTSARIGVGESLRFLTRNPRIASRFMSSSVYVPNELVSGLAKVHTDPAMRVAGYHIFSFNQVRESEAWRQAALNVLRPAAPIP